MAALQMYKEVRVGMHEAKGTSNNYLQHLIARWSLNQLILIDNWKSGSRSIYFSHLIYDTSSYDEK